MLIESILFYYKRGTYVLDCGIGSGLVEESLFLRRHDLKIVGLDYSAVMLDLCRKRLAPYLNRCTLIKESLENINQMDFEAYPVSVVIAVQVVHHLTDSHKRQMFQKVRSTLGDGGIFLLVDRFSIEEKKFFGIYEAALGVVSKSVWGKAPTPLSRHSSDVKSKLDHASALLDGVKMLNECGFDCACVDVTIDRAFLAAVPRPLT
jgi:SAM-dependent methyltransferase